MYFVISFLAPNWNTNFLKYTLKCSQLISSSDNKKILLTTKNVRLDSGHYATKYYFCLSSATNFKSCYPVSIHDLSKYTLKITCLRCFFLWYLWNIYLYNTYIFLVKASAKTFKEHASSAHKMLLDMWWWWRTIGETKCVIHQRWC